MTGGSETFMFLPTVIKCPQPKPLDEFTVIQNPQTQYQFRDYFIVTCKKGYQLIEVRSQGCGDLAPGLHLLGGIQVGPSTAAPGSHPAEPQRLSWSTSSPT